MGLALYALILPPPVLGDDDHPPQRSIAALETNAEDDHVSAASGGRSVHRKLCDAEMG